jgi:hypothetical protein
MLAREEDFGRMEWFLNLCIDRPAVRPFAALGLRLRMWIAGQFISSG